MIWFKSVMWTVLLAAAAQSAWCVYAEYWTALTIALMGVVVAVGSLAQMYADSME